MMLLGVDFNHYGHCLDLTAGSLGNQTSQPSRDLISSPVSRALFSGLFVCVEFGTDSNIG